LALERVLANLLSNAIKYSPQGGEITVSVTGEEEANATWAVVRVCDQGVGIPAHEIAMVFDRFYRASNVTAIRRNPLGSLSTRWNLFILKRRYQRRKDQ